jgi:hypothetical protein
MKRGSRMIAFAAAMIGMSTMAKNEQVELNNEVKKSTRYGDLYPASYGWRAIFHPSKSQKIKRARFLARKK